MQKTIQVFNRNDLKTIALPVETKSYKPISHYYLSEKIEKCLNINGFIIKSEQYISSKNGQQIWGKLSLSFIDDLNPVFIFGNSYDKSLAFTCYSGIKIESENVIMTLCSDYYGRIYRRHTLKSGEEIDKKIENICSNIKNDYRLLNLQKSKMETFTILRKEILEIISELYFEDFQIISGDNLNFIKKEFKKKGVEESILLWDLYIIILKSLSHLVTDIFIKKSNELNKYFVNRFYLPNTLIDEEIPEPSSDIITAY